MYLSVHTLHQPNSNDRGCPGPIILNMAKSSRDFRGVVPCVHKQITVLSSLHLPLRC